MATNIPSLKPFIIGLAGGSASGKSTFAAQLIQALTVPPCKTAATRVTALAVEKISTDDYFLPSGRIPTFYSASQAREMPDFNRPDSLDATQLLCDLDAHLAGPGRPDILLIEGLMVLHLPEIRERCDLRLFVELDADQRALRRLVRNLGTNNDPLGETNGARDIANYFLESAKVGHERYVDPSRRFADFILRGDGDFSRTARMTAGMIQRLIEERI